MTFYRLHAKYINTGRPCAHVFCGPCLTKALESEPLEADERTEEVTGYEYDPEMRCTDCGERDAS